MTLYELVDLVDLVYLACISSYLFTACNDSMQLSMNETVEMTDRVHIGPQETLHRHVLMGIHNKVQ